MRRAGLHRVRDFCGHFITGQVIGQFFVTLFARLATRVLGDRLLKLFYRVDQAIRRVGSFVGVAKVQS